MRVAVLVTVPTRRGADRLARLLVQERLAACVSVAGPVGSVYRWQGKIEKARETVLIAKTRRRLVPALTARVRSCHPYQVPEIIALPILGGNPDYLSWLDRETRPRPR